MVLILIVRSSKYCTENIQVNNMDNSNNSMDNSKDIPAFLANLNITRFPSGGYIIHDYVSEDELNAILKALETPRSQDSEPEFRLY